MRRDKATRYVVRSKSKPFLGDCSADGTSGLDAAAIFDHSDWIKLGNKIATEQKLLTYAFFKHAPLVLAVHKFLSYNIILKKNLNRSCIFSGHGTEKYSAEEAIAMCSLNSRKHFLLLRLAPNF